MAVFKRRPLRTRRSRDSTACVRRPCEHKSSMGRTMQEASSLLLGLVRRRALTMPVEEREGMA